MIYFGWCRGSFSTLAQKVNDPIDFPTPRTTAVKNISSHHVLNELSGRAIKKNTPEDTLIALLVNCLRNRRHRRNTFLPFSGGTNSAHSATRWHHVLFLAVPRLRHWSSRRAVLYGRSWASRASSWRRDCWWRQVEGSNALHSLGLHRCACTCFAPSLT